MGQSSSTAGHPSAPNRWDSTTGNPNHRMKNSKSTSSISQYPIRSKSHLFSSTYGLIINSGRDLISDLPDECLAHIFHSLGARDRKHCSLVCRRWRDVEGQSRHRISLDARSDLHSLIPALFARFDSVARLALKCDRRSVSIGDDALSQISVSCTKLTRLKLRACRQLTDAGMAAFASHCPGLKKLSCGSCTFGAKGINAVLEFCSELEELSVKRLRGLTDGSAPEPIGPGAAASSIKTIYLKELHNGQCFAPLIAGSKNLKSLKLFRCSGDWDKLLEVICDRVAGLMEVHLERLQVSDRGLAAIANCTELEILHLVKTPECTNVGLVCVANRCKLLRKLHIDGWKANRIGDEGLTAVAKGCPNLQELVLIGVNPTSLSLGLLASNCGNLERLALCGSDTIGDSEIHCIAEKCIALRKLCIKGCPVSDDGMEALVNGCPNLVKVKVKKCRGVTSQGADWLRTNRASLTVSLDTTVTEQLDGSASDGGAQENGGEPSPQVVEQLAAVDIGSSSNGRSALSKARMGFLAGRNFVACTFRRWSHSNSHSHYNTNLR